MFGPVGSQGPHGRRGCPAPVAWESPTRPRANRRAPSTIAFPGPSDVSSPSLHQVIRAAPPKRYWAASGGIKRLG